MTEPRQRGLIAALADDAVLSWWEAYDEGASLDAVAERFGVPPALVHLALGSDGLDVLGEARIARKATDPNVDVADDANPEIEHMLARHATGAFTRAERLVMDALGRIAPADDDSVYARHLPYARSLQHQLPASGRRRHQPLDGRQRQLDRLATARWRKRVRGDLRRTGIL